MKKTISLIILFFSFYYSFSQNDKRYDLEYENARIDEIFLQLENKTNLKFYFLEEWIPEERQSNSFDQETIENILKTVLAKTVLNYYVMDNRVIITENNIVHDEIAFLNKADTTQFAERSVEDPEEEKNAPIFLEQESAADEIATFKIGRESERSQDNYYTLRGTVLSEKENEPLSNVAILISGEDTGTQTDINGNYQLRLKAGEHIIVARTLGNNILRKRAIIYNDGVLDFKLSESLEQLNEVVIDSKSDRNVKEAFTGVSVIDVQRVKTMPLILGERDLLKAATTLPGISKAGEGALGFNIRGGREDQNLILLDQGVIYNPNHFFGVFSAINPFTTGSVEIYKGNIPAKYGGRLSSVFDIRTKKGDTQELSGEGSVGPVTGNISLEVPVVKDKSSLIVGGRATYSDWILKNSAMRF